MHKFRMVSPALDRSEKWWQLPDDSCRLTYDWLLWCKHTAEIGIFEMPAAFVMSGLRCPMDEAQRRLVEVERVGLIERDGGDLLRIVGWFKSANAPNSPAVVTRRCRQFRDLSALPDSLMRSSHVFEFILYALTGGMQRWNMEQKQSSQAIKEMTDLVNYELARQPDLSAQAASRIDMSSAVGVEIWGAFWGTIGGTIPQTIGGTIPPLYVVGGDHRGDHPPDHRGDDRGDHRGDKEKEKEKEKEKDGRAKEVSEAVDDLKKRSAKS